MRHLIYFPIVHLKEDLGSLNENCEASGIKEFGEEPWNSHIKAVNGSWDNIKTYVENMPFIDKTKIY